ncbi:BCAS3 microtubule associated cell migration factor-like [Lycorma delicatula]|uniref:BCAS3 microtubule associated cell migration factor-like n=1 Tax=Lycorma delicatula TaxID=130591 RepID=UPI003F51447C
MSADSPRRASRKGSTGHVVLPRPVSDPSLIDSLAGFIHEVVPQAYSSVLPGDNSREAVVWARFELADYNDPALYPDTGDDCDATAPLLLVLGYGNGVQVWSLPASGEAVEVLSWNQRVVKTLRFLPAPESQKSSLHSDPFAHKRPLVAIVDNTGSGPHFCSVNFISLHGGDQVKSIKFKNPINDVLANRRSIVTTFPEKIAVFDALTLEDRMTVTTCFPSPGINPNPVSLGSRWLAYADRRLVSWWRSQGGCEGEGTQSYTATVLHAAKSLGKGLRGLSGSVASSLTGTGIPTNMMNGGEICTPGVVTILDIETNGSLGEQVIAHFVAHCEPIVALSFDPSGLLLLTVDKCGYRFHLFRIHPHPGGPSLCEVHHLYTLHRGDTSARVQDIAFSNDSRWVAVSSLRGTTHVFPVTPYGGPIGVRTHTTPHVVNRLSRFHRSAGLSDEGGRNSPVAHDGPPLTPPLPPRTLPTSHAITVQALAQLRHQVATPSSEDAMVRLTVCFAPPRSCLPGLPPSSVPPTKNSRRALDSLYVMACHGRLIQYDLDPRHISGVAKDRICDDTAIELWVDPKAEWILLRPPLFNPLQPPVSSSNPLLATRPENARHSNYMSDKSSQNSDEHWLSQVEIMTHAGPHRRLWMGPQFTFKTYSHPSSDVDKESIEVGSLPVRSNPVNMPIHPHLLIESGSASSLEQSPHLTEVFENALGQGESRLREDLADAMLESPGSGSRSGGTRSVWVLGGTKRAAVVERLVNPLGTVITIDPEQACPASDPRGTSSLAPNPVTDLIIVPARSASADNSDSKVKKIFKCNVEVPQSKILKKQNKSDITTSVIVKDTNLDKIDNNTNDKNILSINKVVGKTNNKEKRKNGKKDKRSGDSVECIIVKPEVALIPDMSTDKPSISNVELTADIFESKEKIILNKSVESDSFATIITEKVKSSKKNKHLRKLEQESLNESSDNKIVFNEQETFSKIQSSNEPFCDHLSSQSDKESNEIEICETTQSFGDKWNSRSFSDCLKSNYDTYIENKGELKLKNENQLSEKVETSLADNASVQCSQSSVMTTILSETEVLEPQPLESDKEKECLNSKNIFTSSRKNKRKCKTLGKKISKAVEITDISLEPCMKFDEVDLLDSQQTIIDSKLNDVPDLVNSTILDCSTGTLTDVTDCEFNDEKIDELGEKLDKQNKHEFKEENDKDVELVKLGDETTDKDSSDDSQTVASKNDGKCSNQKKRKPNRKQKGVESEIQSDSDTNTDKLIEKPSELTTKSVDVTEVIDKPIVSTEIKPKMSWSCIVSMGKQDANGNFSNTDIELIVQTENSSINTTTSVSDEKDTAVKTSSTEDRGSVYESCSESVCEETTFETEQQSEIQEVLFDRNERTNSDAEINVNADSTSQNIDEDSADKSNTGTDSGEKEPDTSQVTSKKSRKPKRKRR